MAAMRIMVGIRKLSAPNMIRQTTADTTPTMAGKWCFVLSHCSTKMVTNRAVSAKSMPVKSSGRFPSREPMTEPSTQ